MLLIFKVLVQPQEYERAEFNLPTTELLDIINNLRNKHYSLTKNCQKIYDRNKTLEKQYESLDKELTIIYRAYQGLYNSVSHHINNPRRSFPVFNSVQSPSAFRKPDNYQEDSSETRENIANFLEGIKSGGRNTRSKTRRNTRSKTRRNTRSKTRRNTRSKTRRNTRSRRRV